MEIKIYNGRRYFYQWDSMQKLIVEDDHVSELHFTNPTLKNAIIVKCYEKDGIKLCDIPNSFLKTSGMLTVYAFTYENGNYTKKSLTFSVLSRKKPDDYVEEENAQKWSDLEKRIDEIEKNGASEEVIANSIEKYFIENPIEIPSEYINETELNNALSNKANTNHTHSEYANENHTHDIEDIDGLENVGGKKFVVTFSGTSNRDITGDKTFDEVLEAYNNGQVVEAIYRSYVHRLTQYQKNSTTEFFVFKYFDDNDDKYNSLYYYRDEKYASYGSRGQFQKVESNELNTIDKTVVGAINEINNEVNSMQVGVTEVNERITKLENTEVVTSWNDLKDKPFGIEYSEPFVPILETTEPMFVEDMGAYALINSFDEVKLGLTYNVLCNGTTYSCIAQEFNDGDLQCVALGNIGAMTGEGNTSEPFLFVVVPSEMLEDFGGVTALIFPLIEEPITEFAIYGLTETVKKIDEKYLPSGGSSGGSGASELIYIEGGETLAEGIIPSGLAIYSFTDTGLSLYEILQEWKIFFVQVYGTEKIGPRIHSYPNNNHPFFATADSNYHNFVFEGITKDSVQVKTYSAGMGNFWDEYSPIGHQTTSSYYARLMMPKIPTDAGLYIRNYVKATEVEHKWKVTGLVKWGD